MSIKNGVFKKTFQEVPNIEYLKQVQKDILEHNAKIKEFNFNFKNVIEFDTPLLQFILAVKKHAKANNQAISISRVPYSGENLLELYDVTI